MCTVMAMGSSGDVRFRREEFQQGRLAATCGIGDVRCQRCAVLAMSGVGDIRFRRGEFHRRRLLVMGGVSDGP